MFMTEALLYSLGAGQSLRPRCSDTLRSYNTTLTLGSRALWMLALQLCFLAGEQQLNSARPARLACCQLSAQAGGPLGGPFGKL